MVLFANLRALNSLVMFSATTPPGQDHLPYDEEQCAHLGPRERLVPGSWLYRYNNGVMQAVLE